MKKREHTFRMHEFDHDQELTRTFRTSSFLTTPAIFELVRHMARVAAEADYETLLKSGKIPYSDPKHRGK